MHCKPGHTIEADPKMATPQLRNDPDMPRPSYASLLAVLALAGCPSDDIEVTPPEVHITLETPYSATSDRALFPSLSRNSIEPQYTVNVAIDTLSGSVDNRTTDEYTLYLVKSFTATFEVPGVAIPDSEYTTIGTGEISRTYARRDPIVIPASAMGQKLSVHVEAADEHGTPANVLDFTVLLEE